MKVRVNIDFEVSELDQSVVDDAAHAIEDNLQANIVGDVIMRGWREYSIEVLSGYGFSSYAEGKNPFPPILPMELKK
jgi:hypothetical protein